MELADEEAAEEAAGATIGRTVWGGDGGASAGRVRSEPGGVREPGGCIGGRPRLFWPRSRSAAALSARLIVNPLGVCTPPDQSLLLLRVAPNATGTTG